ncbi:MAG TPA: formyltetrahydrofolate deformylase [Balneolales bacterium]|nr:formyltetrahydrofolate deformylase [Balneolales bacterium]
MIPKSSSAILLLSCPDQTGLVSRITNFIYERGGNIIDLDEHVDQVEKIFSIRIVWDLNHFSIPPSDLHQEFDKLAKQFDANYDIKFRDERLRVAIFASKYDHCLQEILWRHSIEDYPYDIPLIISNHDTLKPLADHYKIPFYCFPINKENKAGQESKELHLLSEFGIDTIVLARYMQILSPQFVSKYADTIINIHHSFLPAFAGGNPYKQALERGVKIIGATSHYVTEELDRGPIIEQDIIRVTHKDTLDDLIHKGRDLERLVLARALQYHVEHRILVMGRKTIIFD